jgi:hypothetical protein
MNCRLILDDIVAGKASMGIRGPHLRRILVEDAQPSSTRIGADI